MQLFESDVSTKLAHFAAWQFVIWQVAGWRLEISQADWSAGWLMSQLQKPTKLTVLPGTLSLID